MSTRREASATSLAPQAPKNSPFPPKVPVPKVSAGTLKPEPPSFRYSMGSVVMRGHRLISFPGKTTRTFFDHGLHGSMHYPRNRHPERSEGSTPANSANANSVDPSLRSG